MRIVGIYGPAHAVYITENNQFIGTNFDLLRFLGKPHTKSYSFSMIDYYDVIHIENKEIYKLFVDLFKGENTSLTIKQFNLLWKNTSKI